MPDEVPPGRVGGVDTPCPAQRVGRVRRVGDLAEVALVVPGPETESEAPVAVIPRPSAARALRAALTRGHANDREVARGGNVRDRIAVGENVEPGFGGGETGNALGYGLDMPARERRGIDPEKPILRHLENVPPAVD